MCILKGGFFENEHSIVNRTDCGMHRACTSYVEFEVLSRKWLLCFSWELEEKEKCKMAANYGQRLSSATFYLFFSWKRTCEHSASDGNKLEHRSVLNPLDVLLIALTDIVSYGPVRPSCSRVKRLENKAKKRLQRRPLFPFCSVGERRATTRQSVQTKNATAIFRSVQPAHIAKVLIACQAKYVVHCMDYYSGNKMSFGCLKRH